MTFRLRALGAILLTAGVLAVPSVAHAADADTAKLAALTELDSDGKVTAYPVKSGETVPVVLGVANLGTEPLPGVVVNVRVVNDVDLPKEFGNCQYYVDSNLDGAWCEIDRELAAGKTYALASFPVAAAAQARADRWSSVIFQWYSKAWADRQGGIEALAKADSGRGTTPAPGPGADIDLTVRELPVPAEPRAIGFARVKLVLPPTTEPTATPTATATATPTATPTTTEPTAAPATTEPADGSGGGLPVTGSQTATVAGIGAALLLGGAGALVVARRRRRSFTA
ncbi:LPXTG cell wall anchor domain-containing protein [Actinoplanes sp. NPDC048791]|uniref:LPXTG cell wall anchor domain-containing protein n=1 Tax=Actinoplanes sp. NPDC048791 TaxID=3154623 RepID=UPI0033F36CE9